MAGRYLLDTNILIALFKGEQSVQDELEKAPEVFVPSIALGELFYGAIHSADPNRHLTQVEKLANTSTILNCDAVTAKHYGAIKHELKLLGQPIPENDLWISAIAMQFSLVVVSRDRHFRVVPNLTIAEW